MAQRQRFPVAVVIFGMLILAPLTGMGTVAAAAPCAAWQDDFNGLQVDPALWVVADGQAPGYKVGDQDRKSVV